MVAGPPSDQAKSQALDELQRLAARSKDWNELIQRASELVRLGQYGRLRADETYQNRLNELREAAAQSGAGAAELTALGQYLYEQALITVGEAVEPHAHNRPYRPQTEKSQTRELAQAEQAIDRALTLDPNHVQALAFKGACRFTRDHEWVLAEKYLSRALEIDDKDPVIHNLFAVVLDYIAFVQAAAAADLRSVDTWSDAHYIYYRYPSQAELRRADELDALARRLWNKARAALHNAIAAAPSTAQADYYRSVLAEKDQDLEGAIRALKKALQADPGYFAAAQRLSTIAGKIGQTRLAYAAQSIVTNRVQTSAAPLLKLAWIEFNRSAYDATAKDLEIAAGLDPADPRVAAYRGAVARERGQSNLAGSWFLSAAALEEVRLANLGLKVRQDENARYEPEDVARLMALYNAAASELLEQGQPERVTDLMNLSLRLHAQLSQQGQYTQIPSGLLPERQDNPDKIPEPPTLEALAVWSAVLAGRANVALQRFDEALRQFRWATEFESRKPPTLDQGMAVRIPALWAKLGMVDLELQRGNAPMASQIMRGYGHPNIATRELQTEADRLRDRIEAAGYRPGGQTLTDLRNKLQRQNTQGLGQKTW